MADKQVPKVSVSPSAFDLISLAVVVVSILYTGISLGLGYADLPDRIPIHFNAKGEPDGYGSTMTIWLLFGTQLLTAVGLWALTLIPHHHNYMFKVTSENAPRVFANSNHLLNGVNAICTAYFGYLITMNFAVAQGAAQGLGSFSMIVFMGSLFALIGFFIWRSFQLR